MIAQSKKTHPEPVHGGDGSLGLLSPCVADEAVALAEPRGLVDHRVHRQDGAELAEQQVQIPEGVM
jgi:hypothetical protein